ncbi:HlyD family type I secretion periplasmic adaptor subunit [Sphingomonas prati]|uniref:Membrane fusion protein (MFP) family protein n=1 Tax=Sphingomonas prati TaxID=1843237 RepID=A0A7W9BSL3_9SPHN|nr:HlyD family type I secretion periplasmic adaptor subunit [Sphingomonas prati]MBB5729360.1 adhesin transport system membrane fusion protein [Sphingomonas prati]GGE78107.1 HlyD family type I secretion periplasmic adaptor subunit [Sphingomonas prati]
MSSMHLEDLADQVRPRVVSSVLLWTILAFFGILILWAWFTVLDRSVNAEGRIGPTSQLQVVSNLEGGIVSAILVHTGEIVRAGDPLIRLDQTSTTAELGTGRATVGALSAKLARLTAEMSGTTPNFGAVQGDSGQIASERSLYASRQADLANMISVGQSRIVQSERAVAEARSALEARIAARDSKRTELALIRPLVERGIEPRITLVQTESAAAIAASEAAAASASLARAQSAVAEARATLSQQRQDWRTRTSDELATARGELGTRAETMPLLADRLARTVIRAPRAGRINRVLVATVGGTVRPGDPLVELVPSDDTLVVEAMVKPKDIAFVRTGQRAKVKITAYDSAIYGSLDGRVVTISPDVTIDQRTGEGHYIVRVRTDRDALRDNTGRALPIGPGMIADVSLLGDKRSVLSYLLTPFTRLRQNAFTE